ncbi:hypothetical protein FMZ60_09115 [Alcaligenaceae bacterium SJ-26]|nr:hypothetical protein FMZ60_09115 [Alcaligenaceae bacterium SJ-26]
MSVDFLFMGIDSWLTLCVFLFGLCAAAWLGKRTWSRHYRRTEAFEDELKVVLGASLSLFGLLVGFILSFAISGYNARIAAEENEAIAIGNAIQHTTLLEDRYQARAEQLLTEYLELRIRFYETGNEVLRAQLRLQAIELQTRMWSLISRIARAEPNAIVNTVLAASTALYVSQQKTMASWRRQIPNAAWIMLLLFGVCSNFLIGYNTRGRQGSHLLLLTTPVITALTLFMIAEIDVPGRGLIHVVPDNLQAIKITLEHGGLTP